jgi:PadR family transcriptional regulator, regulatory protein PadR
MGEANDLLHGALELLVLKTLTWGPRHGYSIAAYLEDISGDSLQIEEGSLYPALYRMERKGLIKADWGVSELNRRVKLYKLTEAGRRQLNVETAKWNVFSGVVARVLASA